MKVSLNTRFIDGPAGGGMQFANYLKTYLKKKDVQVINHLKDKDIDIILHISPFPHLMSVASYSYFDAAIYKINHPSTIIVQRINECDERKGTNYINTLLVDVSRYSDFVVYIASWLKPLMEKNGLSKEIPSRIILNGADSNIFNQNNKLIWNNKGKLRIVTHHWGGNYFKGHDIYKRLDELLENPNYKNIFEFTFIGNYPKDISYKNTNIIPPLSGAILADELKKHHIYLTASRNEPAGMHHIEGTLCGLPLLYVNSGALPEYCSGFGIEFNEKNFEEKLLQIHKEYDIWEEKIKAYKNTSDKMCEEFHELFIKLHAKKNTSAKINSITKLAKIFSIQLNRLIYLLKIIYIKFNLFIKNERTKISNSTK
ncbi:MAG: hypothetical protein M0P97_00770 [Candidatus Moranbacteria bacterium]|jgi:hypothetical protein|nr:hypothetical protein [Candidatus Moranbacteria bacterium]